MVDPALKRQRVGPPLTLTPAMHIVRRLVGTTAWGRCADGKCWTAVSRQWGLLII